MHDGFEGASHFPEAEQGGARWRSWTSPLPIDEVQRRLAAVQGGSVPDAFTLTPTNSGFLIRWTSKRRTLVADLTLAAWEAGTQIHLAMPDASRATKKQLAELQGVLSRLVD
jgi:hypothetical protein